MSANPDIPTHAADPTICPFCRSGQVSTTAKVTTDASYWRCQTCGQIWNPARLIMPRVWR